MTPRRRIHLAATPGGHLDLLLALAPAFEDYDRTWITAPGTAADALEQRGERVRCLPRFHGVSPRLATYAWAAGRLVRQERPELVVTSGSGSVAPFCSLARAQGAPLVFLETMARIENPSNGGRLFSRLASSVIVQWPEMTRVYSGALVARPALLEERSQHRDVAGHGTFVAVGTHIDQFDRLLEVVDAALAEGVLPGPGVAQTGVCAYRPEHLDGEDWLGPDDLQRRIEAAEFVVCHAGSGLIARCLRSGRRPLVVPRRAHHGEHVDDHQLQLTRKLAEMGCVIPVEDRITAEHVEAARTPPPAATASELPAMVDLLARELDRLRPPAPALATA